ncbi:MAG TPA: AAA family ATPase [Anaerolineae bacterium]|nr:AAA family ATPase [Anaerolineae bacterium]
MLTPASFIPYDRRLTIPTNTPIPPHTLGTALFADISGFTPLTETLAHELGDKRGAEALTAQLNRVYTPLIAHIHQFGGAVLGFAGDAITCWFANDPGPAAAQCALALQHTMSSLGHVTTPAGTTLPLAIKVALAYGPLQRYLLGNPNIQTIDALAGSTLEQMAKAEKLAERGDIIITAPTAANLTTNYTLTPLTDDHNNTYYRLTNAPHNPPPPPPEVPPLTTDQIRPWLLPPVYNRLQASSDSFLADLRPASPIFVSFTGIDYDHDPQAGPKLDAFIRWAQNILTQQEGYLLQLIIGDKGSYFYASLGAPIAHDNDPLRAVAAARALITPPPELDYIQDIRIGIAHGRVWAGAYGAPTRATYGILGDPVNTAARLMSSAKSGQILVSPIIAERIAGRYQLENLGPLTLKGKATPLYVAAVTGEQLRSRHRPWLLFEHLLIGRDTDLRHFQNVAKKVGNNQGQIIRLIGEAGMGKSHLTATFLEQLARQGFQVSWGTCQSTHQNEAYRPWRELLLPLWNITTLPNHNSPQAYNRLRQKLTTTLTRWQPNWLPRLPLLGDLLGIPWPDTPITAAFDPSLRQASLWTLIIDILSYQARQNPLCLVLEDIHWLDEASADLTNALGRAITNQPILLFAVQRPPLPTQQILPTLNNLPHHHQHQLGDLDRNGLTVLTTQRLGGLPNPLLTDLLWTVAHGNPFFNEELIDTLTEAHHIEPSEDDIWRLTPATFDALLDANCLTKESGQWQLIPNPPLSATTLQLPDSVNDTVLARLDRLPADLQLTLKVATVLGRTFRRAPLLAIHPDNPPLNTLQTILDHLQQRDFIRLEADDDDPTYLFKHHTTQEVAYDTLLFAQRQPLHAATARWYETTYPDSEPLTTTAANAIPTELNEASARAPHYPTLAYHWQKAENEAKERHYATLAGQQAANRYANEAAVRYFSRALELTAPTNITDRYHLYKMRLSVYHIQGQRAQQEEDLNALTTLGQQLPTSHQVDIAWQWTTYNYVRAQYDQALTHINHLLQHVVPTERPQITIKAYQLQANILGHQQQYDQAHQQLQQAIQLATQTDDTNAQAANLYSLGFLHYIQGEFEAAQNYCHQAQQLFSQANNIKGQIDTLLLAGAIFNESNHYWAAEGSYQTALKLAQKIGWRQTEGILLGNIGNNNFELSNYESAYTCYQKALTISQEVGDQIGQLSNSDALGLSAYMQNQWDQANQYFSQAHQLNQQINHPYLQLYIHNHIGLLNLAQENWPVAHDQFQAAHQLRHNLQDTHHTLTDEQIGLIYTQDKLGPSDSFTTQLQTIIDALLAGQIEHLELPFLSYLHIYTLATKHNHPQAPQLLTTAYHRLQTRADRIPDEELRHQYLTNNPAHRQLLALYKDQNLS